MAVTLSLVAGGVMSTLVAAGFGAAGTVLGAVAGLLSGFFFDEEEEGLMQGTLVGAIAGALVSVELADSLVRIWCCSSGCSMDTRVKRSVSTVLGLMALADSRSGRGDRSGGDIFRLEQSSPVMVAVESYSYIPVMELTKETAGAGQLTCPICLYEFQAGESARRLPACSHVFHLHCIDSWLPWKSQCPMCRRDVY